MNPLQEHAAKRHTQLVVACSLLKLDGMPRTQDWEEHTAESLCRWNRRVKTWIRTLPALQQSRLLPFVL